MTSYDDQVTLPAEFDSYSRNGEDVVLWRTLGGVDHGRYIEVGAHDPRIGSVSAAFYDRGWTGITVEPDPNFAALHREQRPADVQIEAAATASDSGSVTLHVVDGTGLSTLREDYAGMRASGGFRVHDIAVPARSINSILSEAGWAGQDIHFLSISTEGSEAQVLAGVDLAAWRPWALAVEVTGPESAPFRRQEVEELLRSAGYRLCLFDGLCCFFAAEEQYERLGPQLSFPACVLDNFTTPPTAGGGLKPRLYRPCWMRFSDGEVRR